ncbi:TPA: oligosaccharide flippase family protein [Photobacterium damselae]
MKKIILFSIGPIIGSLLGFITVPLLAWFFSPDDIGKISIINTIIGFFIIIFSLGGDQVYIREYHESTNKNKLFKESVLPSLILFLFVLIIVFVFDFDFVSFFISDKDLTLWVIFCVFFQVINRYFSLILRMSDSGGMFSITQVLQKFTFVIAVLFSVIFVKEPSFNYILSALFLSSLVSMLFSILVSKINNLFRQDIDFSNIKNNLKYGLPFVPAGIAYWGLTGIDKLVLNEFSKTSELALYSISLSFSSAAIIFQSIFSILWAPTVYRWKSENKGLEQIPIVLNLATITIVLILSFIGVFSWIASYFVPATYSNLKFIISACMIPPLFYTLSEITVIGIGITKKSNFNIVISILSFLLNLFLTYLLVPIYGAAGAAVSTALSYLLFFFLRTIISSLVWKRIPMLKCYCYILPCLILSCFNALIPANFIYNIIWLFIFIAVFTINYKNITELWNKR